MGAMNSTNDSPNNSCLVEGNIEISPLLTAYSQFNEALKIAKSDLEKAGVIQYFEFTYELAWKTLRRILKERGKDLNSPKTVIREAALEKLIEFPELWFAFTEDRNRTVHTYNKAVANDIFKDLHLFDREIAELIKRLKALT